MRGRFRLGLAIGVRSLIRPACSNCSRALDSAEGSTGSDVRSWALAAKECWLRLWVAVGGVLDSGGEMGVGVAMPSSMRAVASAASVVSPVAMAVVEGCEGRWAIYMPAEYGAA